MRALIIYHNDSPSWLYRHILKRGFRHCAVVIDDGQYWVGFNDQPGQPPILLIQDNEEDLAAHYRLKGDRTVQEVTFDRARPLSGGLALNTCVNSIKRLLCIRAWWVLTPHQLYRYLERAHAPLPSADRS